MSKKKICKKCNGKGWFHGSINPVNFFRRKEWCSKCKGTGKIENNACN